MSLISCHPDVKVVDIEVREGRERRRGVVMFKREEEARKAVEAMDGGSIDLQQIVVALRSLSLNTSILNVACFVHILIFQTVGIVQRFIA